MHSFNQLDATVQRKFEIDGSDVTAYLTVQNLINAQPALLGSSTIGEFYPTPAGQDIRGRYFTIGIRANL